MKRASPAPCESSRDRCKTTVQSDWRRTADLSGARHAALGNCRDPESHQVESDRRPELSSTTPTIRRTVTPSQLQSGDHSPLRAAGRKETCVHPAVVMVESGI